MRQVVDRLEVLFPCASAGSGREAANPGLVPRRWALLSLLLSFWSLAWVGPLRVCWMASVCLQRLGKEAEPEWSPVWSPHMLGLHGGKGPSTQHDGPSLSPEKAAVGFMGGEGLARSRPRASEHVSRASTHGNLPMKQEGSEAKKPHNKVLLLRR